MILRFFVLLVFILAPHMVFASADGPDYYQTLEQVPLHEKAESTSTTLITIPANTNALRNQGCVGVTSFAEWSEMDDKEKAQVAEKVWCKTTYDGYTGWAQNKYLSEGTAPSAPTYDCEKAEHEIEHLICESPELIRLDHIMDNTYKAVLRAIAGMDVGVEEELVTFKTMQRGWVKGRDDCWKELENKKACALESYKQRIAFLQAKWLLVESKKTNPYMCGDNPANEFYAIFFNTYTLPAVVVEYGDGREIFTQSPSANGEHYEGSFGKYIIFKDDEAIFVWDQFEPEQNCKAVK